MKLKKYKLHEPAFVAKGSFWLPVEYYCHLEIQVLAGPGHIELLSVWTNRVEEVSETGSEVKVPTADDLEYLHSYVDSLGTEWLWERFEKEYGRLPSPSVA